MLVRNLFSSEIQLIKHFTSPISASAITVMVLYDSGEDETETLSDPGDDEDD